jgi:pilus assembly protein CpaE
VTLQGARFLLLLEQGVEGGPIRAALPATAPVRMAELGDAVGRTPQLVEESAPDLVLVGCSGHSEPALGIIRDLTGRHADCPVVVLYQGNPNGFMDPAFEAGADDLITLPLSAQQLAFSLEKVLVRRRGPAQGTLAPLIAILGPKGGTGKTLTACNLAVALAQRDARPVIVDIDLQFGDVGLALGMKPTQTIYDLAVAGGSLDGEKVDGYLAQHASGARVLLAPIRPDQAAAVSIGFLRKVFEVLRGRYDFVIVDTPPAFTPEVIAAIDSASHLCLVSMLDALSLKDTKIGLETLAQMGYDSSEIQLVLNRADSSVGIGQDDVQHLLGKMPDVLVPSDRAIPRAVTDGRAIVEAEPKSGPGRAFASLADHYLAEVRAGRMVTAVAATSTSAATEPSVPAERRRTLLRRR